LPSHPRLRGCWWSLTPPFHPYLVAQAVCSLWHCPAGCPGLPLTTTLPCGARTFLGSAGRADAAARRCANRVAPSCAASREGPVLLGVFFSRRLTRVLGSLVSRRDLGPFGPALRYLFVYHPPHACAYSFILPRAFRLLQSSTACDLPLVPETALRPSRGRRAPPLGFPSLIAASAGGVHHSPGSPDPGVMFPPRRFSRPRGFAPPPTFAGLFHPAATSRVCPSGDCPSPRSRTGFPRPNHALLSFERNRLRFDPRQRSRPGLQGVAPRDECGAHRGGLDPDESAPLMGFSSSGYSLRATCRRLHTRSARDLHRDEPTAAGLRRFAVARIGLPGFRLPTRSRFPT